MKFFNDFPVIALISDASIDFTPQDFEAPLSDAQRQFLWAQSGRDIPKVFWRKQVHGDDIVCVTQNATGEPPLIEADAFITTQQHCPIAIRTADCVPVFIFDPVLKAIGLAHAGWKGTQLNIAAKTVKQMQDKFGCKCYDLKVALGPSIRQCCYQVGAEFKTFFPDDVHARDGYLYADVVGANQRQLLSAGIRPENIFDSGVCTCCHDQYFSFRRDAQQAGRMISVMMLI